MSRKKSHIYFEDIHYNLVGKYKEDVKDYLGNFCSDCGSTSNVQVHHINRDWTDNRLENLKLLCSWCHRITHWPNNRLLYLQWKQEEEQSALQRQKEAE